MLTRAEKIAILQERGDEHCRRYETAMMSGLSRVAIQEKRAYLRAYSQRDLVEAGYNLDVRIRTKDELLALGIYRSKEMRAAEEANKDQNP